MSFTKINAAGIGSTETVTINGLNVIGDGSFGGNVSIAGTLTYEDVTNVDSVGLITARNGIVVGSGITLSSDGDGFYTGVVTATTFNGSLAASNLTGALPAIDGSALTGIGVGGTANINADSVNVTGIMTATSVHVGKMSAETGIGSTATANIRTNSLDVIGIATFREVVEFNNPSQDTNNGHVVFNNTVHLNKKIREGEHQIVQGTSASGSSGHTDINPINGPIQRWYVNANVTSANYNASSGESVLLLIYPQSYSITWNTNIKWIGGSAPTLDTSKTTAIEFFKAYLPSPSGYYGVGAVIGVIG